MAIGRREFVKSALAAGAAGMVIPSAVAARAHAGGSDRLRVGLIGCGGRGTGAAVQALHADPGVVLVSMGDVFADRLNASLGGITEEMGADGAARIDVPDSRRFLGFDAYKRVIDSGVDVVLLTTYPQFRPGHLKAAVEAGKHVFAEKPLGVDSTGVRRVLESASVARANNTALLVGFCWRYNQGMKATFEKILGGGIGRVVSVHTTYHTSTLTKRPRQPEWSDTEFQLRNWWHFTWLSGDHVVEQAVHSIDRLSWATGDRVPAKCVCLGGRAARSGPEHGNVYDHFAAIYEYADGSRAFHTCRQIDGTPSDNTDYVYGTDGSATINGWVPTYQLRDPAGKERWSFAGEVTDMYQNEHDALFKSIRAGKPINDGERGAQSSLMAIMARMSAYTGQTVTWEQAMNSKEDLTPAAYTLGPMPTPEVAVPGKTKLS
jgi:myo-inositol 2-dehydrogenase/D-chiro-inositol 1-dehydrogenase